MEADFQWGSSHASMDQGSCLLAFPSDVDFAKGQHPIGLVFVNIILKGINKYETYCHKLTS